MMRSRTRALWPGLLAVAAAVSACSHAVSPVRAPVTPTPSELVSAADALVRAGCLDCLIDAYAAYDRLRAIPAVSDAATTGAIRTGALIAIRERELGMVDEGYVARARTLLSAASTQPAIVPLALDVADALPFGGVARAASSDADLNRNALMRAHRDAWSATLSELAPTDLLASYVWLAFSCGSNDTRASFEIVAPTDPFRDVQLVAFRSATCRTIAPDPLHAILERDPRFVEVKYYLALYDVRGLVRGVDNLDEADRLYAEAYAWHPAWPLLTQAVANIAMTVEEFDRANTFYDRTLSYDPRAADTLLGKARALTYQGRNAEAIATLDLLVAEHWLPGDARYWRALNLSTLGRNDEAWTDIEEAAKLLVNADVPKLAGLIAYRRRELDISRAKFDESRERNPKDCETGFYLGVVLAEQRLWPRTAEVLSDTAQCLEAVEQGYRDEIASIRASHDPPERQASKIARREGYIASGRRQIATSCFNVAVAYYNLSQKVEARVFAERVADDEQFGERAREILARLNAPK
jgi:tetratricopeptide (TPR) repeat protein